MAADCGWVLLHLASLQKPSMLSQDQRWVQDSGANLHSGTSACGPQALGDPWPNSTVCNRLRKGVIYITSTARGLHSQWKILEGHKLKQLETTKQTETWRARGGFI